MIEIIIICYLLENIYFLTEYIEYKIKFYTFKKKKKYYTFYLYLIILRHSFKQFSKN